MTSYHRLTFEEREEISRLLAQKRSFQEIACGLGRNVSTISREINSGGCNKYTYRAGKAHLELSETQQNARKAKGRLF